jgi:hypothetical protein
MDTDVCLSRAFAEKRAGYGWFWTQVVGGGAGEGAVIMPKFQPLDRRIRASITHYEPPSTSVTKALRSLFASRAEAALTVF